MPTELTLRRASGAVALVGIGVATYITIENAGGGAPVCIAGGGGCETVANSSYSHLMGVNVAVFGILGYVMLLGAAFMRGDAARFGGLMLAMAGFGFSAYLTYLELFVIDAICQWCVGSAVLMTVLFVINAVRAYGYAGSELRSDGTAPPLSDSA